MLLARLGLKDITVYDDDTVEGHNLGHQAFGIGDIGKNKAQCLALTIHWATDTMIKPIPSRTDGKDIDTDILILAVDNMASRKEIVENAKFNFCVDGRMGGETFNVFTFISLEKDDYLSKLYTDDEASPLPCGGRAIGYTSYMVSAIMEIQVKRILLGEEIPKEINMCCKNLIIETSKDN